MRFAQHPRRTHAPGAPEAAGIAPGIMLAVQLESGRQGPSFEAGVLYEWHCALGRSQVGRWCLTATGAIAVALLCASPFGAVEHQRAPAETKPNFSGQWVLESISTPGSEDARTLSVQHGTRQTPARGRSITAALESIAIERDGSVVQSHQIGIVGGVVGGIVAGKDADGRPMG